MAATAPEQDGSPPEEFAPVPASTTPEADVPQAVASMPTAAPVRLEEPASEPEPLPAVAMSERASPAGVVERAAGGQDETVPIPSGPGLTRAEPVSYALPPELVQIETSHAPAADADAVVEEPAAPQQPRRPRRPPPEPVAQEPLVQVETRNESSPG